jgi:hypothetical protein
LKIKGFRSQETLPGAAQYTDASLRVKRGDFGRPKITQGRK